MLTHRGPRVPHFSTRGNLLAECVLVLLVALSDIILRIEISGIPFNARVVMGRVSSMPNLVAASLRIPSAIPTSIIIFLYEWSIILSWRKLIVGSPAFSWVLGVAVGTVGETVGPLGPVFFLGVLVAQENMPLLMTFVAPFLKFCRRRSRLLSTWFEIIVGSLLLWKSIRLLHQHMCPV